MPTITRAGEAMSTVTIDPNDAVIDLDLLTLTEYLFDAALFEGGPLGQPPSDGKAWYFLRMTLTGGFGRVPVVGDVADYGTVTVGSHLLLDDDELDFVVSRLRRWRDLSIPLRYLEFGQSALIIEDLTSTLRLPPGSRELRPNAG